MDSIMHSMFHLPLPVMEKILSKTGAIIWFIVVGYALSQILPRITELKQAAELGAAPVLEVQKEVADDAHGQLLEEKAQAG